MSIEQHTRSLSEEKPEYVEAIQAEADRKIESGKKLDAILSSALDDSEKPDEFEDFVSARSQRQELKERHGTDTAGILKTFTGYQSALNENPEVGAELIKGDYLARSNLATMRHAERAALDAPAASQAVEGEHHFKKMDRIIGAALDEHFDGKRDADRAEMEAARPLFEAQKKANPSLTWSQFFDNTVAADRQLWRDPNYADRLAAASGMPVTPLQKEAAAITRQADARVASFEAMQTSGELPQLERYAPAMLQIMQSKEFVRTNDERLDLQRVRSQPGH